MSLLKNARYGLFQGITYIMVLAKFVPDSQINMASKIIDQ